MVRVATNEYSEGGMIAAGHYHFLIEKAEWSDQYGSLVVEAKAVAGNQPGEIGREIKEFFKIDTKAANRFHALLVACGMTTRKKLAELKEAGQDLEADENALVGRSFCAEVQSKVYEGQDPKKAGKSFPGIDFRIYSVRDAAAANIPKQEAAAKLMLAILNKIDPLPATTTSAPQANGTAAPANGNGNGNHAPAPTQQPAPAPVGAVTGSVDDMFGG